MRSVPALVIASALLCAAPAAAQTSPDRPMGNVFDWGHELNQDDLPNYVPRSAPMVPAGRWYRTISTILRDAGQSGLWFSGPSALPFPPLPLAPNEPVKWRNPRNFRRMYTSTGLKWDVAYEVWAARKALKTRGVSVLDATVERTNYTQRVSLLDPVYRRVALGEIRRIVPGLRRTPYVAAYRGSDEPLIRLPRGGVALRSRYARWMTGQVRAASHLDPPRIAEKPTTDPAAGLRWLAYNRWAGDRFMGLKAEQAQLIHRLSPGSVVLPNDFGFINGFVPWDYTRLADFADVVEADPYVAGAELDRSGRGRYNPGFGAKFLSDLTGKRVRINLQAFTYGAYTPTVSDLYTWGAQALRAGATDLSLFASDNPRFTDKTFYAGMLRLATDLRGTSLPAPPTDPTHLVVYSTAAEGQGQPDHNGDARYLASGDALYTLYSLLGELNHGAFSFDADTRLLRDPSRLTAATTVWLPRGDTLDRPFAEELLRWVRAGGTLIVTDPQAFTRAPDGSSLADVRDQLIGATLGDSRPGTLIHVAPGAVAPSSPKDELFVNSDAADVRAFTSVPAGATVLGAFLDGSPAIIRRSVGAGRVVAFSANLMQPENLDDPGDLTTLFGALHTWSGGGASAAWNYTIPGAPDPAALPWSGN